MTAAERTLLLAVLRWARDEGAVATRLWPSDLAWYVAADDGASVLFTHGARRIKVRRGAGHTAMPVADIRQAVDLLAALGVIPARFSSAYRAGWDACVGIMRIPGAVIRTVTPQGDDGRGTSSGTTRVGPR